LDTSSYFATVFFRHVFSGSVTTLFVGRYREVVQLLLAHEASTNILDVKGSSPLHLAAWTGNVDIVRLLLCHGPSVPNVNLTVSHSGARVSRSLRVCDAVL